MKTRRCFQPLGRCILSTAVAIALSVLVLTAVSGFRSPVENAWQQYHDRVAPPITPPVRACWYGTMCNGVVSGTAGGTWVIEGPNDDLKYIQDYQTGSFDQRVVARSDGSVTVRIRSDAVIDTEARYPLDPDDLPSDVQPYLEPESIIQSDAPEIVQLADELVQGADTEAQAVVGILDWVRANISYDYTFELPIDALSVYHNRSGVCAGFASLSTALLRAAGIPARVVVGCALWSLPDGGGHAWIETYYPDVGWVPSEPQGKENYVDQHLVAPRWWEFCGQASTTMTYTERLATSDVHASRTRYDDAIWSYVTSANVPSWDRNPAWSSVSRLSSMVTLSDTESVHRLELESTHCYTTTWRVTSSDPWLTVSPSQGNEATEVTVTVDTSEFPLGLTSGTLTMVTPADWYYDPSWREIPVDIWVVEDVHRVFLPLVARD